jgi:hypothetical protein
MYDQTPQPTELVVIIPVVAHAPNELAELEKVRDGINRYMGADIEKEAKDLLASTDGITVAGHAEGPKAGREATHSAYMKLVRFQTQMIDAGHELYKKPITALGKLLDGRKNELSRMIEERKAALKADRDAYDATEKREKAEAAAKALAEKRAKEEAQAAEAKRVLQARIQRLVDLGATPNVIELAGATDEQFEAMVTAAAEAQAKLIAQQEADRIERDRLAEVQRARTVLIEGRTGELLRAGVPAFWKTLDELADMDADEFAQKLADSIEAKALADQEAENAKIEREEKAERIRTRSALALALGWSIDAEWLGTATDAEFQAHLATATTAKEQRDRDAADLERLRKDATERAENERLAREAQEKADREAHEAAEAERIAAEEADRIERERPDKEKALRWLDGIDHELVIMQPVFAEPRINDMVNAGTLAAILQLHKLADELRAA